MNLTSLVWIGLSLSISILRAENNHYSTSFSENTSQGRQEYGLPVSSTLSSAQLHSYMTGNQQQIQNYLSQGYFVNSPVSLSEYSVDGQPVFNQPTLECLKQSYGNNLPASITVGAMMTSLETLNAQGSGSRCAQLVSNSFNVAISANIASSMGALPSLSQPSSEVPPCIEVEICSPFFVRPVFPVLNFAARVVLFPFRLAGNIIANGIAFRQGLRYDRQALGLDVASVQSMPYFWDRVAARIERRQLGLSLIPFGPRRTANRLFGR